MSIPVDWEFFGIERIDASTWRRTIQEHSIEFRELRTLDELGLAERMQREVMMIEGPDVIVASFLVVAPDTAGSPWAPSKEALSFSVAFGYGGYQHPEPFLYSDFWWSCPKRAHSGSDSR